jgi:ABC-2 type transport system permease protein
MVIWSLAKKELRLLMRDRLAAILLLGMPFLSILLLGLLLGEGFWEKPDERLRVSLVDLDQGDLPGDTRQALGWLTMTPGPGQLTALSLAVAHDKLHMRLDLEQGNAREAVAWLALTPGQGQLAGLALVEAQQKMRFPRESWARMVRRDLEQTAEIRVEIIPTLAEAKRLCSEGKRSAVLVFGPQFSDRVGQCSFLAGGINPFYRDGVSLKELDADLLQDETQLAAAKIIEQVSQVTLLRVVLPWMIGKAFDKLSKRQFIDMLGNEVRLPVPRGAEFLFTLKKINLEDGKASLNDALKVAASDERALDEFHDKVGAGVQNALRQQFSKYELTGKTWADLTKSERKTGEGSFTVYVDQGGMGPLKRGALRYQILVPSYTVMFAFSLMLTVGWLFVSERRQGTLKRLRAAPITRSAILLGKLLPCFLLSLAQGLVLLGMGKLVFGMRWGPASWSLGEQLLWLLPVVACTSLAATGLAMFVASIARTEIQVAIAGSLLVVLLALISGCLIPRELMPEAMKQASLITPHAWALDAYRQLMLSSEPNLGVVTTACGVLAGFGAGFVALAWWLLPLD